jgi:hypothetical protein
MTQLSPQAQAVLNAANNAQSYHPDDCLNESRAVAAAALRAAAEQLTYRLIVSTDNGDNRDEVVYVSDLLAISDELEAQ